MLKNIGVAALVIAGFMVLGLFVFGMHSAEEWAVKDLYKEYIEYIKDNGCLTDKQVEEIKASDSDILEVEVLRTEISNIVEFSITRSAGLVGPQRSNYEVILSDKGEKALKEKETSK
jgi:hypothetical protein